MGMASEDDGSLLLMIIWYTDVANNIVTAVHVHSCTVDYLQIQNLMELFFFSHITFHSKGNRVHTFTLYSLFITFHVPQTVRSIVSYRRTTN